MFKYILTMLAFVRSKLIGVTLTKKGVPVIHIDENDRQQTQETVIKILTNGQLFLLGDGILPSCKPHRYLFMGDEGFYVN